VLDSQPGDLVRSRTGQRAVAHGVRSLISRQMDLSQPLTIVPAVVGSIQPNRLCVGRCSGVDLMDSGSRIEIVDYDHCWTTAFRAEAARVADACGGLIRRIEHIGSTSVPGLSAKPVIDLMAEAVSATPDPLLISSVEGIGYLHRPEEFTDRLLFSLEHDGTRTHNLHVVGPGQLEIANEVLFRDRLRADPGVAFRYAQLKQELATRAWGRFAYSRAKTEFIVSVVDEERSKRGMAPVDIWSILGPERRGAWIRSGEPMPDRGAR
jgi:GrpB-like predicted nucleotidyltransferase (UPF0157 family)